MNSIDPIHGDNPFALDTLHPGVSSLSGSVSATRRSTTTATTASTTAAATQAEKLSIDEKRLVRDKDYLNQVLSWIVSRADQYFRSGQYVAAEREFRQYFRYMLFYGVLVRGLSPQFFNSMFQFNWLMETQNRRAEATRFNNQVLLRLMESYTRDTHPNADPREHPVLRGVIEDMQISGHIPTLANLEMTTRPADLIRLAEKLAAQKEFEAAQEVANLAQINLLFDLMRVNQFANKLTNPTAGEIPSYQAQNLQTLNAAGKGNVPFTNIYELLGLPYIPTLATRPDPASATRTTQPAEINDMDLTQYFTHRIEPIHKDPNEDDERHKRQQKLEDEVHDEHHRKDVLEG